VFLLALGAHSDARAAYGTVICTALPPTMKSTLLTAVLLCVGLATIALEESRSEPRESAPQESAPAELEVVTVTHEGTANAALSRVGMRATLRTKATTAEAALESHGKLLDRALSGMSAAGVEVSEFIAAGLGMQLEGVDPNQQFGGMVVVNGRMQEPEAPDRQFECRQELTFYIEPGANHAATAQLLALAHDTAHELGLELSPPGDPFNRVIHNMGTIEHETLVFRVTDEAKAAALAAAERQALDAARAQAERLVAWSGRGLGKVRALRSTTPVISWSGLGADAEVKVSVTVSFALER
jgi:uncharacterized protein YggE